MAYHMAATQTNPPEFQSHSKVLECHDQFCGFFFYILKTFRIEIESYRRSVVKTLTIN